MEPGRLLALQSMQAGVQDRRVLRALAHVDRRQFLDTNLADFADYDSPLNTLEHQTTTQPSLIGRMCQALDTMNGEKVLEIGTGPGYEAAILAEMGCHVVTIERVTALYKEAKTRLARLYPTVAVILGDGTKGAAEFAPFDRIICAARSDHIPPEWKMQLVDGGLIVMPLGTSQETRLVVFQKRNGWLYQTEDLGPVNFVPLIEDHYHEV